MAPSMTNNVSKGTSGADVIQLPFLTTAIDHDDASTPTSLDNLLVHASSIPHGTFNRPFSRVFIPRISVATYQGAFTGYASEEPQWIDSNNPAVQHYGFKYIMEAVPPTATSNWVAVYVKMWVSLRYPTG